MAEAGGERPPPVVADAFLGGRLLLRQPAEGHRCGTDAVLLAAAAPADFSGLAIDVGAGVGAAGLALALARPGARIGLLENDPFIAGLARANLLQNKLAGRGQVLEADVLSKASRRGAGLRDESAGLVITNPPFLDPGRRRFPAWFRFFVVFRSRPNAKLPLQMTPATRDPSPVEFDSR